MIRQVPFNSRKGFTLIELVAVVMVLSVVTYLSINLFNSVKSRDQLRETRERMDLITAKTKQFYHTHERLPAPAGADSNQVPVGPDALDMEQKYRLDAWGRYLVYDPGAPDATGNYVNIQDVGGKAAEIVSGGPDQVFATPEDNLGAAVDVTAEAVLIARRKLKVLQEKVAAYDAIFAGVDNDGDGVVDNIPVDKDGNGEVDIVEKAAELTFTAFLRDYNTCPPTNRFANDPSEGRSTLSAIEDDKDETGDYNCEPPVVDHMVDFYGLPDKYKRDPWDRPFKWGYETRPLDNDEEEISISDRRYHRFYSSGPSEEINEDDITFSGN